MEKVGQEGKKALRLPRRPSILAFLLAKGGRVEAWALPPPSPSPSAHRSCAAPLLMLVPIRPAPAATEAGRAASAHHKRRRAGPCPTPTAHATATATGTLAVRQVIDDHERGMTLCLCMAINPYIIYYCLRFSMEFCVQSCIYLSEDAGAGSPGALLHRTLLLVLRGTLLSHPW